MTKAQAAQLSQNYMDNQDLMKAREKDQERMRARRLEVDLQEMGAQDLYGNKKAAFGAQDDDVFGGEDDFQKYQAPLETVIILHPFSECQLS